MLFDTHAHYDDAAFDADRGQVLASLPGQGVGLVVNPGCNLASSRRAVELAERFDHVYAGVGVHPSDAADFRREDLDQLRTLAAHPKVKAIGEVGLDYHWEDYADRDTQKACLRAQLALAEELDLPVLFHDREAHGDMLAALAAFYPTGTGKIDRAGVLHCFSGSPDMAEEVIRRGFCIGLGGAVTFKNARRAVEVAASIPLDTLLLETDAPYMAPVPYRGSRCDSGMIAATAARIAEIRGVSVDTLLDKTRENACRLFGIPGK